MPFLIFMPFRPVATLLPCSATASSTLTLTLAMWQWMQRMVAAWWVGGVKERTLAATNTCCASSCCIAVKCAASGSSAEEMDAVHVMCVAVLTSAAHRSTTTSA